MPFRGLPGIQGFVRALRRLAALFGAARLKTYRIKPSAADPRVTQYDEPSLVVFDGRAGPAPLVVFLPGTDGKPRNARHLMRFVARQGYRAIALKYNDTPAVDQVCPADPDPSCSEAFRRMRTFGEGASSHVSNPPAESIAGRLTSLLTLLQRRHPKENWGAYLRDGAPDWERMIVSGFSQGAGMAALIAKRFPVAKVVLFSGPWDVVGPERRPAPWLSSPAATPADRWFAGYNSREKTARAIARAYEALAVPAENIQTFDLKLPERRRGKPGAGAYHRIAIRDRRYEPKWRLLFGAPPQLSGDQADARIS